MTLAMPLHIDMPKADSYIEAVSGNASDPFISFDKQAE
jgi:hypothetical protein